MRNKANPSRFDQPVFYRIEMLIIEVVLDIAFVAQSMFPKTLLPDTAPSVTRTRSSHRLFGSAHGLPGLSKAFFDDATTFGVIAIFGR